MNNLSNFLQALRQKINKSEINTEKISKIISLSVGIEVEKKSILVRDGVIKITSTSTLKQEIQQKKSIIIGELKNEGISIYDIR